MAAGSSKTLLAGLRQSLANLIAPAQAPTEPPARRKVRMYAGAEVGRLMADWNPINTSGDSELVTSIRLLRARSRALVRDNEYAKNALRIVASNVIGGGVRMQATVKTAGGKLIPKANRQIEDAWSRWSRASSCHTAGRFAFQDMEAILMKALVRDGEVLVRKVKRTFGDSRIPFALEVIEADRLVDFWTSAVAPNGNQIRMGVEVDDWMRPIAYWLTPNHPGDFQFTTFVPSRFIRVPAEEMIHLYVADRWPQTRGEPWMHSTIRRLRNIGGAEEAEIVKARAQASIMGFVVSPEAPEPDDIEDGERITDMTPGQIEHLLPGEQFQGFDPSGPNPSLDPFLRHMLRAVAAGIGLSYESLSRDYSQSNYSSSRLALLDDRDLWRALQGWFIRAFREQVHHEWLEQAVLSGEVQIGDFYTNRDKYEAVQFKPRGWTWVDPTKEVQAFRLAVRAGFMTVSDVIEQTGSGADAEEVFLARRAELDMMADLDLVYDTDPSQVNDKGQAQPNTPPAESELSPAAAAAAGAVDPEGNQQESLDAGDNADNPDNSDAIAA